MGMEDLLIEAERERLLDYFMDQSLSAYRKEQQVKATPDPDAPLTAEQVAKRLNITVEQVLAFAKDGSLRYIDVSRGTKVPRYRFSPTDVEAFKEQRTHRETPCLFTVRKSRRSTGTTSMSSVVDFTAALDPVTAAKRKK